MSGLRPPRGDDGRVKQVFWPTDHRNRTRRLKAAARQKNLSRPAERHMAAVRKQKRIEDRAHRRLEETMAILKAEAEEVMGQNT